MILPHDSDTQALRGDSVKTISIELTDYNLHTVNTLWWKQLMSLFLQPGRAFEIRCWREEKEITAKASSYGMRSEDDCTDFEVSIKGTLTSPVIQDILSTNQPTEEDRMTEFFTIQVEGLLSSSHYGKEIYIFDPSEEVQRQLSAILTPIQQFFVFGEYRE